MDDFVCAVIDFICTVFDELIVFSLGVLNGLIVKLLFGKYIGVYIDADLVPLIFGAFSLIRCIIPHTIIRKGNDDEKE